MLGGMRDFDLRFAYKLLRAAWFGWLVAMVVVFAYPVSVLEIPGIHDLDVNLSGSVAACVRDDCAPESWLVSHLDWTWSGFAYDYAIWLPLLFAVVIPTLIHGRLRGRLGAIFDRWPRVPGSNEPLGYRRVVGYFLVPHRREFVMHIRHYVMRMSGAMLLSFIPFFALLNRRLIKNYGCVAYATLSIPEYITYAGFLLLVIVVHIPTPRQVFGVNANEFGVWRKEKSLG